MPELEQKFLDLYGEKIVYTLKKLSNEFYEISVEGHLNDFCIVEKLNQDFKKSSKITSLLRNLYPISHITFK